MGENGKHTGVSLGGARHPEGTIGTSLFEDMWIRHPGMPGLDELIDAATSATNDAKSRGDWDDKLWNDHALQSDGYVVEMHGPGPDDLGAGPGLTEEQKRLIAIGEAVVRQKKIIAIGEAVVNIVRMAKEVDGPSRGPYAQEGFASVAPTTVGEVEQPSVEAVMDEMERMASAPVYVGASDGDMPPHIGGPPADASQQESDEALDEMEGVAFASLAPPYDRWPYDFEREKGAVQIAAAAAVANASKSEGEVWAALFLAAVDAILGDGWLIGVNAVGGIGWWRQVLFGAGVSQNLADVAWDAAQRSTLLPKPSTS